MESFSLVQYHTYIERRSQSILTKDLTLYEHRVLRYPYFYHFSSQSQSKATADKRRVREEELQIALYFDVTMMTPNNHDDASRQAKRWARVRKPVLEPARFPLHLHCLSMSMATVISDTTRRPFLLRSMLILIPFP